MASVSVRKKFFPIPPFRNGTFLTIRSQVSKESHKRVKKLLIRARSLHPLKKDISESDSSIYKKLTKIYLESPERKAVGNGPFIKCNYLEELVMKDDLNYLIIKLYPKRYAFFIKNPYGILYMHNARYEEEPDLLTCVDNQEIPSIIFDLLDQFHWDLLYDYHMFLKIEKFISQDENAEPLFSSFILLKPTPSILFALTNKFIDQHEFPKTNYKFGQAVKRNESEVCIKMSEPLCLHVDQTIVLELVYAFNIYSNLLASVRQKPFSPLPKSKRTILLESLGFFDYDEKILQETILDSCPSHVTVEEEESKFPDIYPSFSIEEKNKDLYSTLVRREIINGHGEDESQVTHTKDIKPDRDDNYQLVEVFSFKTRKNMTVENKKISVYLKRNLFYSCLTFDDDVHNRPLFPTPLTLVGNREQLDKYIFKIADILSNRFNKDFVITHKNLRNKESQFFPKTYYNKDERAKCLMNDEIDVSKEESKTFKEWRNPQYIQSDCDSDENYLKILKHISHTAEERMNIGEMTSDCETDKEVDLLEVLEFMLQDIEQRATTEVLAQISNRNHIVLKVLIQVSYRKLILLKMIP